MICLHKVDGLSFSIYRRNFLKIATASVCLVGMGAGGVLLGLKPADSGYDPDREISPTREQLALLRAVAEKYDFVCFADTNHKVPEIPLFCTHPAVLEVLSKAGKRNYYNESSEDYAYMYDKGTPLELYQADCSDLITGSWINSDEARSKICSQFREAIENEAVRFSPVDYRNMSGDFEESMSPGLRLLFRLFRLQNQIYGAIDDQTPIMEFVYSRFIEDGDFSVFGDSGDWGTVENIEEDLSRFGGNGGTVKYGESHLCHSVNESHDRDMMISILQEKGYSTCVINIYKDSEGMVIGKKDSELSGISEGDVDMIVFPDSSNPSGVVINNKGLEELYHQALLKEVKRFSVSRRGLLGLNRLSIL